MQSQFVAPHPKPESIIISYIEFLMEYTYQYPSLMRKLVYVTGASSILLSAYTIPKMALNAPLQTLGAAVGVAGMVLSAGSALAQHHLFGFPVSADEDTFPERERVTYKNAEATLIRSPGNLPLLKVVSRDVEDMDYQAGYVEGLILAPEIKKMLDKMFFIYPALLLALGAPFTNHKLGRCLEPAMQNVPDYYMREMQGKVDGYNQWLKQYYPDDRLYTLPEYFLLQLLPDLRNYNPFPRNHTLDKLLSRIAHWIIETESGDVGCTTIAIRLGDLTFIDRILDWPSHNIAGSMILRIVREKIGCETTEDVTVPIISGGLTMRNKSLLVEINVAHGPFVTKPEGMPAILFNRMVAENAHSVQEAIQLLKYHKPLGAYHMTMSDGSETISIHHDQSTETLHAARVDELHDDKKTPQLLIVANHGVRYRHGIFKLINYRDSTQRMENIHALFNSPAMQEKLQSFIDKQLNGELSQNDMQAMKETMCRFARLPLVDNAESVLFALFALDSKGHTLEASVATDQLHAQRRELSQHKSLM